jgi:hypothetical protein
MCAAMAVELNPIVCASRLGAMEKQGGPVGCLRKRKNLRLPSTNIRKKVDFSENVAIIVGKVDNGRNAGTYLLGRNLLT